VNITLKNTVRNDSKRKGNVHDSDFPRVSVKEKGGGRVKIGADGQTLHHDFV